MHVRIKMEKKYLTVGAVAKSIRTIVETGVKIDTPNTHI
jgi:hypothetical protein